MVAYYLSETFHSLMGGFTTKESAMILFLASGLTVLMSSGGRAGLYVGGQSGPTAFYRYGLKLYLRLQHQKPTQILSPV